MDYIKLLFFLIGICIIVLFFVFYSYISTQVKQYIFPLITTCENKNNVNKVKIIMKTLDHIEKPEQSKQVEAETTSTKNNLLEIIYDFIKRNVFYYGKPILHNSVGSFL
jgi:hypothetical protein